MFASQFSRLSVLLAALFVCGACAGTSPPRTDNAAASETTAGRSIPLDPDLPRTADGLVLYEALSGPGSLYLKPPRPNLTRYDSMLLLPAQITYKEGAPRWTADDEESLRRHFDRSLRRALGDTPAWPVVESPTSKTLFVAVSAINLEVDPSERPVGSHVSFLAPSGDLTLIIEMSADQEDTLLRFVERRRLPGGNFSGHKRDHTRMKSAMTNFSRVVAKRLSRYYEVVREVERIEREAAETGRVPRADGTLE